MAQDNLKWINVDVATDLDQDQQDAYALFQEAKEAFEALMQAYAPAGKRAVFSHRGKAGTFGMAMVDKPTARLTLAEWKRQREATGRKV